jgi:hypothetical protein
MIKAMTIYICVVAVIAVFWAAGGREYYTLYGSQLPRPELGQTIPLSVNHGKMVYITPEESKLINVGNTVAITVLSLSIIGLIFWPLKRKPACEG